LKGTAFRKQNLCRFLHHFIFSGNWQFFLSLRGLWNLPVTFPTIWDELNQTYSTLKDVVQASYVTM